jgi:MFS superfamily sulfate permease-like transporter
LETGGLVEIPVEGPADLAAALQFPDWSGIFSQDVWIVGLTLAAVGSLETLLCLEAIDGMDPAKQRSDANRELVAQGIGNAIAGLLGGIPMTAVIVRGSANVQSGAKTRISGFTHGLILLGAIAFIPFVLNQIPLAALAAILLHIGYKLAPVSLMREMGRRDWNQLLPFAATLIGILLTDLLIGVAIGLGVALFFVLRSLADRPDYHKDEDDHLNVRIVLGENVSFLTAASLRKAFDAVPDNAVVIIDGSKLQYIDRDALELIHDFKKGAQSRGIATELVGVPDHAA